MSRLNGHGRRGAPTKTQLETRVEYLRAIIAYLLYKGPGEIVIRDGDMDAVFDLKLTEERDPVTKEITWTLSKPLTTT